MKEAPNADYPYQLGVVVASQGELPGVSQADREAKYTEALAEFERAYEIAPHPLVLYNIASCHREMSHYGEAVKFYLRTSWRPAKLSLYVLK